MDFVKWEKIPRLHRDWQVTEKVDGTNGVLMWTPNMDGRLDDNKVLARQSFGEQILYLFAGSRTRWLTPLDDNFGFAGWALENVENLVVLGSGRHFGEWYGKGIQRGYGMAERRFALFDQQWNFDPDLPPTGCDVVPVLTTCDGADLNSAIADMLEHLRKGGSVLVPGFDKPEGLVIKHTQMGNGRFKVLLEGDSVPKGISNRDIDGVG